MRKLGLKRLDQGHLYAKLEVLQLTCPGLESNLGFLGGRRALKKRAMRNIYIIARDSIDTFLIPFIWFQEQPGDDRCCSDGEHHGGYSTLHVSFLPAYCRVLPRKEIQRSTAKYTRQESALSIRRVFSFEG
jgi:hypothetical protein